MWINLLWIIWEDDLKERVKLGDKGHGWAARIPGFPRNFFLALLGIPFGLALHHFCIFHVLSHINKIQLCILTLWTVHFYLLILSFQPCKIKRCAFKNLKRQKSPLCCSNISVVSEFPCCLTFLLLPKLFTLPSTPFLSPLPIWLACNKKGWIFSSSRGVFREYFSTFFHVIAHWEKNDNISVTC